MARPIVGGHVIQTTTPGITITTVAQFTLAATTATALTSSPPASYARQAVIVQADPSNTGTVYVGGVSVTNTNCLAGLSAGASISIPVDDASAVYVYTTVGNQKVNAGWI